MLRAGFLIGDIADGFHKALGSRGPRSKPATLTKTPNVFVVDCSARVMGHSEYKNTKQYFQHWNQVLTNTSLSRYDELS